MNQELYSFFDAEVLAEGRALLEEKRQRSFRPELTADGRLRLSARYPDRFNFVDRAQMLLSADGSSVDSARCDCSGRSAVSFCPHCAALLLRLEQEEPALNTQSEESGSSPTVADRPLAPAELPPAGEGDPGPGIRDLTYRFTNCRTDLYPGVEDPWIPLERFEMVFGRNLVARNRHKTYGAWGGSCFGMVSSSSLFYHPGNNISVPDYHRGASIPAELTLDDRNRGLNMTLHTFIELMQVAQVGPNVNAIRYQTLHRSLQDRLTALCRQVEAFEAEGTAPVIMEVYKNDRYQGGHAVLPFHHERLDRLRSRLHIYDPNCPCQVRICELRQDRAGNYQSWRFLMSDNTEYSSDNGGVISFLPHEVYQALWDNRAEQPPVPALFSTACEDLTLQDEAGTPVLTITAGRMSSLREDVIPIFTTDSGNSARAMECWINPGTYRVINEDPARELSFSFTGQNGELQVETESEEAVVTVNDDENVQKIEIVEGNQDFWVALKDMAKEIIIRAVSSAAGSILMDLAGKLMLRLITGSAVTSFQINGENADVNDYLVSEDHEEAEADEEDEDEALLCTNKPAEPESPRDPDPV